MKDLAHTLGVIYRDMRHISSMQNRTSLHQKNLYDTYTKAKARQYKQMRNIVRTRHK